MKRIMKISILSLWIYGGALTDAQIMEQVKALQETRDQLVQGAETMNPAERQQYSQQRQKIDGETHTLLNQLSDAEKQKIAKEFMGEFNTALSNGNEFAVANLLFNHNAPYISDLPNFISFDAQLAVKLTQIHSSNTFNLLFKSIALSELYNSKHISSIGGLVHFIMTGLRISA